jgi:hypothetical protein
MSRTEELSQKGLDDVVLEETASPKKETKFTKTWAVDTAGNITYSLIVGGILDYRAGLDFIGILSSRASASGINAVTGGIYGLWREKVCKFTRTTKESGRVRKTLADLLAFNTFQLPVYGTALAIGSLASEGHVNWEKVQHGMTYLACISPAIGPTMGLYMDRFRRVFGIKSAAEGSYGRGENRSYVENTTMPS